MKFQSSAMTRRMARLFNKRGATTALFAFGLAGIGPIARADFAFTTPRIQGAPGATVTVTVTETLDGGPTDGGDTLTLYIDKTFIGTAVTDGFGKAAFTFVISSATTPGIHSYSILSNFTTIQGNGLALVGSNIVVIDTDAGTIGGSSTTFNGTAFTKSLVGGNERFTFLGDLTVPAATYCVLGSHTLTLLATNNMTITTNALFDTSGAAVLANAGGGAGGVVTANFGAVANGGLGKDSTSGGSGGVYTQSGNSGNAGGDGNYGTNHTGNAGTSGGDGVNATRSGSAGGGGGTGGVKGNAGSGGNGGSGGSDSGHGGDAGKAGTGGTNGGPGSNGGDGGAGQNIRADNVIAGGGGGGAGGGAGSGGSGGSGGAGGAGGGGANSGGDGGNGGGSGNGGDGGAGGRRRPGGAGSGAVEVIAYGRLTVAGAFQAAGGFSFGGVAGQPGSDGGRGYAGVAGNDGSGKGSGGGGSRGTGGTYPNGNGNAGNGGGGAANFFVGSGGGGGAGGGAGGFGNAGGYGGAGAGGAGGDIKLFASVINGAGSSIYAAGGAGSGAAAAGQTGRFLYGANNSGKFGGAFTSARLSNFAGATAANNLITGSPQTPYIPDLPASGNQHLGAQIYGVTGLSKSSFSSVFNNAGTAVAALYRVHVGPVAPVNTDFTNVNLTGAAYDYVFFVNLSNSVLSSPTLGIGQAGVALGGSGADKNAAGGTVALGSLAAGQVYATLVPAGNTTNVNATFSIGNVQFSLTNTTLGSGDIRYIQITPPIASLAGAELNFGVVGQNVTVPNFGNNAPTTEITIEFWQRVNAVATQSTFILSPDNSSDRINAHVPFADGQVYWDFGTVNDGGRLNYFPPVSIVGSWQHFAFVSSQSGANNPVGVGPYMAIYRNGVREAYKAGSSSFAHTPADLLIGGNSPLPFAGQLDEFRIWNIARPASNIAADVNASLVGNEPGLVAYYKLDEGKAASAYDSTANHFDGAINGATWSASGANINTVHVPYNTSKTFALAGFDPSSLGLTYAVATPPVKGTLTQGSGALFTFAPFSNYDGNDTFTYTVSNGATTSAPATVNVNFGIPVASLSGTLTFSELVASAANQNVTFQFRDAGSGAVLFTRSESVPAGGAYSLPYVPLNNYNVQIKPDKFLAKVVAVTAGATTFNVVNATLTGGDANNDNSVDVTDFGILVGAYGSDSSVTGSGYDVTADFNGDGLVDVTDFSILVGNYGQAGDM